MKKKLALICVGIVLVVNTASPICGTVYCPGGKGAAGHYCSNGLKDLELIMFLDDMASDFC
ncbi:MAG: hypothetical protein ACK5KL_17190 [Dysgonomonas sp.]